MYVRIRINDKDVNVMLDLGMTYLFCGWQVGEET
jgi:hypothetical protein